MDFLDYFQSYKGYYWQWEEDANVLSIPQEHTIAYREFIADVLKRLSLQGLPPFGTLLLTIIATNPNGKNSVDTVYAIVSKALNTTDDVLLANGIEFLKLLSEVPAEFKEGKKRLLLLQALFENCHNRISVKKSKDLVYSFSHPNSVRNQLAEKKDFHVGHFKREFNTLSILSKRLPDVNAILARVASLPDLTEPLPELEAPEVTETKDLPDQLTAHPKTFHVGSLIKRIWSGLNIPLHSALPSHQPLGGIADLTNKGDFDKLLVSEFANEDIVFLSRLANNEALYIHREIPPASNNLERIILIDISLKNWGTPKTVAFATMLAIATHPKTTIACSAFVVGNSFQPVNIDNVASVIDGLQILEGSLHAADGLTAFFKEHPIAGNREVFFITEPSTLKYAGMAKALSSYQSFINYWIFTDGAGHIDIYKKQQSSKKHIQHLTLPLAQLWEKEPKREAPIKSTRSEPSTFPLLFRSSPGIKALLSTPDKQTFLITEDRALLRFFDQDAQSYVRGWELLQEKLPVYIGDYEVGWSSGGEYIFLMFDIPTRTLTIHNLDTGEKNEFNFPGWTSVAHRGFIFQNDKFFHLNHKGCWSIDMRGITEVVPDEAGVPPKVAFESRSTQLKKVLSSFRHDQHCFKNIREIFINENDELVFNIHALRLAHNIHLKLEVTSKKTRKSTAMRISDTEFTFNDGSTIEINRIGLIILKSSNSSMPFIYLSSFLNSPLAACTATHFTGNAFYYPEELFDVFLENTGDDKLQLMRTIQGELKEMSLTQINAMMEQAPCRLFSYRTDFAAKKLQLTLQNTGAKASIRPCKGNENRLEKISVPSFCNNFINPFIQNILSHGA